MSSQGSNIVYQYTSYPQAAWVPCTSAQVITVAGVVPAYDLTTATGISLDVFPPGASGATGWNASIVSAAVANGSQPSVLMAMHVFGLSGVDTPTIGTYKLVPVVYFPSGTAKLDAVYMQVVAENG